MEIDILMPSIGAGTTQGKIIKWYVSPGDKISAGDVIADIETDKAIIELEALDEGTLNQIMVAAGDADVPIGSVIGKLKQQDGATPEHSEQAPSSSIEVMPSIASVAPLPTQLSASCGNRRFSSPAARNIARNLGIDITEISGSGPNGRVVKFDVQQYAFSHGLNPRTGDAPIATLAATAAASVPVSTSPSENRIAHSNIRKTIAKRLSDSKRESPHFYLTNNCYVDELLNIRAHINKKLHSSYSLNDLLVYIVAKAFKKHPNINTEWHDEFVIQKRSFDISIAVSTDKGLITPILKDVDKKSLDEIFKETRHLIRLAKEGRLKPEQYEGGGLTLSNLGMYGVSNFYAIINPPQSAILSIGTIEKKPIVVNDQIVIGQTMNISISADHRVIDGSDAALFIGEIKNLIENPIETII